MQARRKRKGIRSPAPALPGLAGTVQASIAFFEWLAKNWAKLPVKYRVLAGIVVAVLLVSTLAMVMPTLMPGPYHNYTARWDVLRIRLGLMRPRPYVTEAQLFFNPEDMDVWDSSSGNTRLEIVDNLKIRKVGPDEMLFVRVGGPGEALYNFNAQFDLVFRDGQTSAAWVVRAQRNNKDYYYFHYTFPRGESAGILRGRAYRNSQVSESSPHCEDHIYRGEFPASHILRVTCAVVGKTVTHTFKLLAFPKDVMEPVHPQANSPQGSRPCVFDMNPYPFGKFAFIAKDKSSIVLIRALTLSAFGERQHSPETNEGVQ